MTTESTVPTRSRVSKVLIVDDHPIVREGLSALISTQSDLEVCGHAEGATEAIRILEAKKPEVVIVDISLQDSSGLDLIRQIRAREENICILVSSMYDESLYAERALRAGAMGYINKQEATRNILTAIRRVLTGKVFLSDRMSDRLLERVVGSANSPDQSPVEALSDRELEVFSLIGNGLTTSEIAERLNLSVKTIETYRQRIKEKLALRNAADLARHASQWVLESA